MAVTSEPDKTPLPGTVFTQRQVRILKIAVIVMGLLLAGGFAFVLAVIVYQATRGGQGGEPTLTNIETELPLPQGATVSSIALDGDRLALHLNTSGGPQVVVVDLTTGKIVSRLKLNAR